MTLVFKLTKMPYPQNENVRFFEGNRLVIGRGDDADWTINDPDKYVSREHCIITGFDNDYRITDCSSGGLFIDGSTKPIGNGQSVILEDGMRLRLGHFEIAVSIQNESACYEPAAAAKPTALSPQPMDLDPFFSPEAPAAPTLDHTDPPPQTQEVLESESEAARGGSADPKDFFDQHQDAGVDGAPSSGMTVEPTVDNQLRLSDIASNDLVDKLEQEDPFEPKRAFPLSSAQTKTDRPQQQFTRGSDREFFGEDDPFMLDHGRTIEPIVQEPPKHDDLGRLKDLAGDDFFAASRGLSEDDRASPPPMPDGYHHQDEARSKSVRITPDIANDPTVGDSAVEDPLITFLRGAGIDPQKLPGDTGECDLETLGRRFRMLVDGLVQLLRMRTEVRHHAKIDTTVITSSRVSALKFLPSPEETAASLVCSPGSAYLAPDEAIEEAFRDLTAHQRDLWVGIEYALRRMLEKFDPSTLEREIEETSVLERLVAGGRQAKLWELYERRFREIARSAENDFLGEIGADFRRAYENEEDNK